MPIFHRNNIQELKAYLYNSYDHDAKLENVRYDCGEDSIKIELYNPIYNVKINLTCNDIRIAFAIKGDEYGSRETIISLAVEENFPYLQNYIPQFGKRMEDSLYLLIQTFSGDELHIVSKEVILETVI